MTTLGGCDVMGPRLAGSGASVVRRRSRRQLGALNKECQFSFPGEEPGDLDPGLDPGLAFYRLDEGADAVFPPLPVRQPRVM